jgi:hypothetical protein
VHRHQAITVLNIPKRAALACRARHRGGAYTDVALNTWFERLIMTKMFFK